ncbi:MAG TPA: hypothetical protein VK078_02885, partial [Pseudogracilibacillus sp.]|nr:hypothetical protein [Pseudogracilibacillus sp.]
FLDYRPRCDSKHISYFIYECAEYHYLAVFSRHASWFFRMANNLSPKTKEQTKFRAMICTFPIDYIFRNILAFTSHSFKIYPHEEDSFPSQYAFISTP